MQENIVISERKESARGQKRKKRRKKEEKAPSHRPSFSKGGCSSTWFYFCYVEKYLTSRVTFAWARRSSFQRNFFFFIFMLFLSFLPQTVRPRKLLAGRLILVWLLSPSNWSPPSVIILVLTCKGKEKKKKHKNQKRKNPPCKSWLSPSLPF